MVAEVAGHVHARLGALAVDSWNFSDEFSQVIARHHNPDSIKDHRIALARALAAGDAIAHHIEDGGSAEEDQVDDVLTELLDSVGIDEERAPSLVVEVQDGFMAFAKIL